MVAHAIVLTNMIKEVPREQQTAAYRLFHHYHQCMVQQMFTIDPVKAAKFGTFTTGDAARDRENRQEWVQVRLSVPQMCDLVDRGAGIMFINHEVATKVYLDLVEHLRNWVHALETDRNLSEAPVADLRKFDELAAMIFPYAAPSLMKNEDDSGYGAFMAKLKRGGRLSVDWRHSHVPAANPVLKRGYRPLSDTIAELVYRRSRGD